MRCRAATAIVALALGLFGGCGPSGLLVQLAGEKYPFPAKKVLKGAIEARLTESGVATLTSHIRELLPKLLGANAAGWACIDVDQLIAQGGIAIPLSLGPFKGSVGARGLSLCVDLAGLEVAFIPNTAPARVGLKVDHAKVALQKPAIVAGEADLGFVSSNAACLIDNDLATGTAQPYMTEVSFDIEATLEVDSAGRFTLTSDAKTITVHAIGVKVTQDCALPECTDQNPGNIGDPCVECTVCDIANFGSDLLTFLNDVIGDALGPLLADLLDLAAKPLLDQLLNGRPLAVAAKLTLSNLLAPLLRTARTLEDLALLVRPAPDGFEVSGQAVASGLTVRLEGGTAVERLHSCAADPGFDPVFATSPFPELSGTLPDGSLYDVGLAISQSFLNQGLWSAYLAGVLCARLDSAELAALTNGKLDLRAGHLDALIPGTAALAGRSASVRVALSPKITVDGFPVLRLEPGPGGQGVRLRLRLLGFGVGIEAYVDTDYMRLLSVQADVDAALDVIQDPANPKSLILSLGPVTLANVTAVGGGAFAAARLDEVIRLGVEVLTAVLTKGGLLSLPFDTAALAGFLGDLPVTLSLVSVGAIGIDTDWLGLFLRIDSVPGGKPGTVDSGLPFPLPGAGPPGCQSGRRPPAGAFGLVVLLVLVLSSMRRDSGTLATPRRASVPSRTGLLVLLAIGCSPTRDLGVPCRVRADCPEGYGCHAERQVCVPEAACSTASECCPGLMCFGGACRRFVECLANADCASSRCEGGTCVAPVCASPADCRRDEFCVAGRCALDRLPCGDCGAHGVCDPVTRRCLVASTTCLALVCPAGTVRVAIPPASGDVDCRVEDLSCRCVDAPPAPPPRPSGWLSLNALPDGRLAVVARDLTRGDVVAAIGTTAAMPDLASSAQVLDGLGSGPVVAATQGPRGGVLEPGPDVGRWLAVTLVGTRLVGVALDASRGALRRFSAAVDAQPVPTNASDLDPESGAGTGTAIVATENGGVAASYFVARSDHSHTLRLAQWTADATPTLTTLAVLPPAPSSALPCGGCALLEACITVAGQAKCAFPDPVARCEPACTADAVCAGGVCQKLVRRAPEPVAWRDAPGSETAIVARDGGVWVLYHDHTLGGLAVVPHGTSDTPDPRIVGPASAADLGHHLVATASPGGVTVVAQDAARGRLMVGTASVIDVWAFEDVDAGGVDPAVAVTPSGATVIAHGATDGSGVRVLVGVPGHWTAIGAIAPGHVGRANALALVESGAAIVVLTLRDALDASLNPAPRLESRRLTLP